MTEVDYAQIINPENLKQHFDHVYGKQLSCGSAGLGSRR